jgi:hypothetical protein
MVNNKKQLKQHAPHNRQKLLFMCMFTTTENKTTNTDQTVILFRYFLVLLVLSIWVSIWQLPMTFRAVIFAMQLNASVDYRKVIWPQQI